MVAVLPPLPPFCSKTCFDDYYPSGQSCSTSTAAAKTVGMQPTPSLAPKKAKAAALKQSLECLLGTAVESKKDHQGSFTASVLDLDLDTSVQSGLSAKSVISVTERMEFTKQMQEEQRNLLNAIVQGRGKSSQRKCITESWKLFKESTKHPNHNDFAVIMSGVLNKFPKLCEEV